VSIFVIQDGAIACAEDHVSIDEYRFNVERTRTAEMRISTVPFG
jgi:hypothetical protein